MTRPALILTLLLLSFACGARAQVFNIDGALVNADNGAYITITVASPADEAIRIQNSGTFKMTGASRLQTMGGFFNGANFESDKTATVEFNNTTPTTPVQYTHTATAVTNNKYKFGKITVIVDELNINSPLVVQPGGELNISASSQKVIVTTNGDYVEMQNTPADQSTISYPNQGGGPVSINNNFVNGTLRYLTTNSKTQYEFPLGTKLDGLQFMRLQFSPNSITNNNVQYLEAKFKMVVGGGGNKPGVCGTTVPNVRASDHIWEYHVYETQTPPLTAITEFFIPGDSYTLVMKPNGYDASPFVAFTAQLKHTGDATFEIVKNQPSLDCFDPPSFYDMAIPALNKFSEANPMFSDEPLPIELLTFNVQPLERSIRLMWAKEGKEEARSYNLERSIDIRNFATILNDLPAAQYDGARLPTYDFIDRNVEFNTNYYYRVRELTQSGEVRYSNILEARIDGSEAFGEGTSLSIYPNPSSGNLELSASLAEAQNVRLQLVDMLGRSIFQNTYYLSAGPNAVDLSPQVRNLPAGTYQLVWEVEGKRNVQKLIRY